MILQNQNGPFFAFASFLMLATLGAFVWESESPNSSRPQSSQSLEQWAPGGNSVQARLWQDPFNALTKTQTKQTYSTSSQSNSAANRQLAHPLQLQLKQFAMKEASASRQINIIAVMVNTAPYPEAEERRAGRRYALVSALSESGYAPTKSTTIDFTSVNTSPGNQDSAEYNWQMPYEWYSYSHLGELNSSSNSHTPILVLWLDEDKFLPTPIESTTQLMSQLCESSSEYCGDIKVTLLGPGGSPTLQHMFSEFHTPTKKPASEYCMEPIAQLSNMLGGFHVLSPFATMAKELYSPSLSSLKECHKIWEENKKITFTRSILTDDRLTELLVDELAFRGITNYKKENDKLISSSNLSDGTVVLISELDTNFGRALPESFKRSFCRHTPECRRVKHFTYLRGLDGIAPGVLDIGRLTAKAQTNSATTQNSGSQSSQPNRRPVGSAQYDYLKRLATDIYNLDRLHYRKYGKGIVAIGVLGSDVHDKLIVLQSLRNKFPSIQFFTTDLDSQLLHEADFKWNRNLIVASSFGLKVNDQLQTKTPPFRNAYQTSLFLSALFVAKFQCPGENCQLKNFNSDFIAEHVKPILIEVGRYGPVKLTHPPSINYQFNIESANIGKPTYNTTFPKNVNEHTLDASNTVAEGQFLLIAFLCILFIVAVGILDARWLKPSLYLMGILLCFSMIGILASKSSEPLSFINGTSIWPSVYIRFICFFVGIYFFYQSVKKMRDNKHQLSENFLIPMSHTGFWKKPTRNWAKPTITIVYFLVSVSTLIFIGKNNSNPNHYLPYIGVALTVVIAWFLYIKFYLKTLSLNDFREQLNFVYCQPFKHPIIAKYIKKSRNTSPRKADIPIELSQLWVDTQNYGGTWQSINRTLTSVVLYLVIAAGLFILLGSTQAPIRGNIAFGIDKISTILSVISMLFLIFFVFDNTRLCNIFIRALTEHKLLWKESLKQDLADEQNIHPKLIFPWVKMQIIAQRTQVIGDMIYYPYAVIVLMLLARTSYFDQWGFPQALAVIVAFNIFFATTNAFRLKSRAEKARQIIVSELDEILHLELNKKERSEENIAEQTQRLIDEINNIKTGAYRPVLEQPAVRAFAFMLGGLGVSITQYTSILG